MEIEKRIAERSEIRKQILSLSKQRTEYIAAEQKKRNGGAAGFDVAVSTALREQLAKKDLDKNKNNRLRGLEGSASKVI